MSSLMGRFSASLYKTAKGAVSTLGLRRTAAGRKLIAMVNAAGGAVGGKLLLSDNEPIVVYGHKMFMGHGTHPSVTMISAAISGQYEPDTTRLFEQLIRPGMTVLDVGAHVGYYTLVAAKLVGPRGRVYAFEPDPRNCAILRENIKLNNYENVEVVPCAVADKPGVIQLYISNQGNDRNSIAPTSRDTVKETALDVETVALSDFVRSKGSPKIGFIKMDVEGAEILALKGMGDLVRQSDDVNFIVEFNTERLMACGFAPVTMLEELGRLGFELQSVEDGGSLSPLPHTQFSAFAKSLEGKTPKNLLCSKRVSTLQQTDDSTQAAQAAR